MNAIPEGSDEESKPSICLDDSVLDGIPNLKVGDTISVMVTGKISEISDNSSKQYTDKESMEVDIEVVSASIVKSKAQEKTKNEKDTSTTISKKLPFDAFKKKKA